MRVKTAKVVLAGPLLRLVEQAGADAQAAHLRVDTRLVGQVCKVLLSAGPRVPDDLVAAERDPRVRCEPGLVHRPPVAELVAREPDRVVLADVGAIPCSEQHGDA